MRRGFTLIELLTVIAIIAILAGILIPSLVMAGAKTRKTEAQNMINSLEMAIENFRLDYNQYPWRPPPFTPDELTSADVIRELIPDDPRITAGQVPTQNKYGRPYLTSVKERYIKDGTMVDPWGQEYIFDWDNENQKLTIYSIGPNMTDEYIDGDDDYGDDITSL